VSKRRATKLLKEWRELEQSGACAFFLDLQECKYKLEQIADRLTTEIYWKDCTNPLSKTCDRFEAELGKYKNKAQLDLLAGLKIHK
jgi:hypothetical protein